MSTSLGAGLGVVGVGYLLGGKARVGATLGGALAGSLVSGIMFFLSERQELGNAIPFLLVWPTLGATLVYALSDAFFPEPTRSVAPAGKDKNKAREEDEYVRVLPMVSATRTGGIIGGFIGRF